MGDRGEAFDAVIIGSGQAGNPLASSLAAAGWRVAIVERYLVGGSCINWGCTPTKTLIASAQVAHKCRQAREYGIILPGYEVDWRMARTRRDAITDSFRGGSEKRLDDAPNIHLIHGQAMLRKGCRVSVVGPDGVRDLQAERIFINTGCRARIPDLPGLQHSYYLDSTTVQQLEEAPSHLLVLGAGYIGLEFAQMFRRLGAEVTVISRGKRILSREDPDVSVELQSVLESEGIRFVDNAGVRQVKQTEEKRVELAVMKDGQEINISGSHLLVATGRRPNTEALGLEEAGVQTDDDGYIRVNARLETTAKGIFALGDVKGGPAFTHISYDDYRIVSRRLLSGKSAETSKRLVSYVIYTDPQLGRVGLSEAEARHRGIEYSLAKIPMSLSARASELGETAGFIKVLIDPASDRILGAAALCLEGGELMSMIQVAIMGGLKASDLRDASFAHPTLAEVLNTLFSRVESHAHA